MSFQYTELDHVVVRVRDIVQASQDYEKLLGTPGVEAGKADPSGGFRNTVFPLGNSGTVVELCQGIDATKQAGGAFVRALERRGEGLHNIALAVDNMDAAIENFNQRGISIIPNARFHNFFLHPRMTHGVLIQVLQRDGPAFGRRFSDIEVNLEGTLNYARLHHIDIAVQDISQASRDYEELLGISGTTSENAALGVLETHFPMGNVKGALGLYQPSDTTKQAGGAFARFLERAGEGVQCVALAVDNAEEALERSERLELPIIRSQHTHSFFLHPRATHGVLIQIMQER